MKSSSKKVPYAVIADLIQEVSKQSQQAWRDPDRMTQFAAQLAAKHGLQPTKKQLSGFRKAYAEATKHVGANGPSVNIDSLIRKYANNSNNDAILKAIKALVK